MGVAIGDSDSDGRGDIVVADMAGQGHAVFRQSDSESAPVYRSALDEMGLLDLVAIDPAGVSNGPTSTSMGTWI